jgi:hypothetical protein
MFGPEFKECWYEIPGAYGLLLSGDLRFKSKRGRIRKMQYEREEGRPCISIHWKKPTKVGHNQYKLHIMRVTLHRAVMSVVLGGELDTSELVLHKDDDVTNCWPDNLYIGDHQTKKEDAIRNHGGLHWNIKLSKTNVDEICASSKTQRDPVLQYNVNQSLISMIRTGKRRYRE